MQKIDKNVMRDFKFNYTKKPKEVIHDFMQEINEIENNNFDPKELINKLK